MICEPFVGVASSCSVERRSFHTLVGSKVNKQQDAFAKEMGAVASGEDVAATSIPDNDRDINAEDRQDVRTVITIIYVVFIAAFTLVWYAAIGIANTRAQPSTTLGLVLGVAWLGINAFTAQKETIGTYAAEREEMNLVERNSFNVVAALFAFGSLLSGIQRDKVKSILPFMMLSLFFGVVLPMVPVSLSTVEGTETIIHKHIKSAMLIMALAFMTAAISRTFFPSIRSEATVL